MFKSPEFKVGLTVLAALVILVAGILWGTRFTLTSDRYVLQAVFDSAYGLDDQDPVTVYGVRQGHVSSVQLQDDQVLVTLVLHQELPLPADTKLFIKNEGLMGEKFIAIEPGTSMVRLDPKVPIPGANETSFSDVFGGMGELLAKVESTLDRLAQLVGDDTLAQSIKRSVAGAEKLVRSLSAIIHTNKRDLETTIQNFKQSSQALKGAIGTREEQLGRTLDNFASISDKLETTLQHLEELAASLKGITGKIESDGSTLGAMVNTKELYDKLMITIKNLDALVKDVKENPDKYTKGIKLEIF